MKKERILIVAENILNLVKISDLHECCKYEDIINIKYFVPHLNDCFALFFILDGGPETTHTGMRRMYKKSKRKDCVPGQADCAIIFSLCVVYEDV